MSLSQTQLRVKAHSDGCRPQPQLSRPLPRLHSLGVLPRESRQRCPGQSSRTHVSLALKALSGSAAHAGCQHSAAALSRPVGSVPHRQPRRWSQHPRRAPTRIRAAGADVLKMLGLDFLTFLAATVLVIPVFKSAKLSPILGFLFSGLLLGQLGLFRNQEELEKLSELGVLFLLFEMGLELSLDRLKALAKYAFGLGSLQMLLTTSAFTLFALPVGQGVGTQILVKVFHVSPQLASIRSVDEAIVIGAALSLSSSAFVLQLLGERGEMSTRVGSATLGILLLQDIAVVPFLVLLPLVESNAFGGGSPVSLLKALGPTAVTTVGSLGLLLVCGRIFLRRIFELVAAARSDETFVALCLLTVTGASLITQKLGFSDTLGAFAAGVLLAETNFRTQVEADIKPFRGMLLGLFFVSTGASLDVRLMLHEPWIVLALLGGLLAVKVGIIGAIAPSFGLTKQESIRTAFLLCQGGEFAFVLLSLAAQLKVLPDELNRLLIIVVVLSMALTPALAEIGVAAANSAGPGGNDQEQAPTEAGPDLNKPVVICGFGELGQVVANIIMAPPQPRSDVPPVPYVAFDIHADRVNQARAHGFNCLYGDASRAQVLRAAHVEPRALAVTFSARARAIRTVEALRDVWPQVPIFARALDTRHAAELKAAGADSTIIANVEAGANLAASILSHLGTDPVRLAALSRAARLQMEQRAKDLSKDLIEHSTESSTTSDDDIVRLDGWAALLPEEGHAATGSREGKLQSGEHWQDLSLDHMPGPAAGGVHAPGDAAARMVRLPSRKGHRPEPPASASQDQEQLQPQGAQSADQQA